MSPHLAVVILNWNGKDCLQRCLESIGESPEDVQVFVADNASTDGSLEILAEQFPRVSVIRFSKNLGFTSGYNTALQYLGNSSAFVLMLNNDTVLPANYLSHLNQYLRSLPEQVGMVALPMRLPNGQPDSFGVVLHRSGLGFNRRHVEDPPLCPSGGAAVYRTSLIVDLLKISGEFFDTEYAFYNEDLDVGIRAQLRGWLCTAYAGEVIIHEHSYTMTRRGRSFALTHSQRNQVWCIVKNYPRTILLGWSLLILGVQVLEVFYHSFHLRTLVVLRAKFSAILGMARILEKRHSIQATRRISDTAFKQRFATSSLYRLWSQ